MTVGKALSTSLDLLFRTRRTTAADVADAIDIDGALISKFRSGTRWPNAENLERLRKFFDVPPFFLLKPDAIVTDTSVSHESALPQPEVSLSRQAMSAPNVSLGVDMSLAGFPDQDLLRIFLAYWAGLPTEAHQRLVDDAHQLKMHANKHQARLGNA